MFHLMDGTELAAGELITEQNLNWQAAEDAIRANANNISLLGITVTSTEVDVSQLRVHKLGRIVTISGRIAATKVMESRVMTTLFTLPVGFRPFVEVFYYTPQINTGHTVLISVTTAGIVRMYIYGDMPFNVGYPVGVNVAYGSSI